MRKLVLASLLAVVAIGACSPAAAAPPLSPTPPSSPSPSPSAGPTPSDPAPTPRPQPTDQPQPVEPRFTADEQYLIDGLLRGVIGCEPVRAGLHGTAVAGIDCTSDDPAVARVGFYLFEDDEAMLEHYFARLAAEGVAPDAGDCHDGAFEGPYFPGEGLVPERNACFINDQGYANYRVTLAGDHVYIGVLGRSDDAVALVDFAFRFNRDTPGIPTLWVSPRG
jgi:hypothetical protein